MPNFELNYTGQEVNDLLAKADTSIQQSDLEAYHDDSKQDVINDLATIRSGAELGATALQSVPEEYVKNTDYATTSTGGVIKASAIYSTAMNDTGNLYAQIVLNNDYSSKSAYSFISKGTLENLMETWTFTLKDGSEVVKHVCVSPIA